MATARAKAAVRARAKAKANLFLKNRRRDRRRLACVALNSLAQEVQLPGDAAVLMKEGSVGGRLGVHNLRCQGGDPGGIQGGSKGDPGCFRGILVQQVP